MKNASLIVVFTFAALIAGCEVQSGITKKSLEKYNESPTPAINVPTPEPIDPADVITVDTTLAGPLVSVSTPEEAKKAKCDKYNKVMINGDGHEVNINGACSQIMINGDGNKVTVTAVAEVVSNGTGNSVEYYKYSNGKRPIVTDNAGSSTVTKGQQPDPKQKTAR